MLNIGFVGLPNAGKSTLFNAITQSDVLAANYPFATIEPNTGIVPVIDGRLDELAKVSNSKKIIPNVLECVDIAGIVAGASKGAGLGNKFLAHIREVDMIAQVVRVFEDSDVIHVDSSLSPERDLDTVKTELLLADLESIEKQINRLSSDKKKDLSLVPKYELALEINDYLARGEIVTSIPVSDLKQFNLLTTKPWVIIFNLDENQLNNSSLKEELKKLADPLDCIFVSAKLESELAKLSLEDRLELLSYYDIKKTSLEEVASLSFKKLGLISFFTSGEQETRAWDVDISNTAIMAASRIHNDIAKHLIKVEVATTDDFIKSGGWSGVKKLGLMRTESKDYVVKDGDVVYFQNNA